MTQPRRRSPHARIVSLLSYALRHHPDDFGATLDAAGWTDFEPLLERMRSRLPQFRSLNVEKVVHLVRHRWSERFEVVEGRIRARYGHSLSGITVGEDRVPPERLFHGTTQEAWQRIQHDGLRPLGRYLVHLTSDLGYACRVAGRASQHPCILRVDARRAHAAGVVFLQATRHVWQSKSVPAAYLTVALALSETLRPVTD